MNQIDNVISQTIGAGRSQNHKFELKLFQSQLDRPKLNMIYL